MVEFTIPTKSFVVNSIKKGRISVTGTVVTNLVNMGNLAFLPRLGAITPLEWDVTYGINGYPGTDRGIEWALILVDIDNLPLIDGIRSRAIWQRMQRWEAVGTDSGPIQTLTMENKVFFNPTAFTTTEFAGFSQRLALAVMGNARDGGAASADCIGTLTYAEALIQRVFGNDNATWEGDEKNSEGLFWEDQNEEE